MAVDGNTTSRRAPMLADLSWVRTDPEQRHVVAIGLAIASRGLVRVMRPHMDLRPHLYQRAARRFSCGSTSLGPGEGALDVSPVRPGPWPISTAEMLCCVRSRSGWSAPSREKHDPALRPRHLVVR